jgi:hypothetical protein
MAAFKKGHAGSEEIILSSSPKELSLSRNLSTGWGLFFLNNCVNI